MNKELIAEFINKVAQGDESAKETFAQYCSARAKGLTESHVQTKLFESIARQLNEFGGDSPIRMEGDKVFVNGKQVGFIENDINNLNSDIVFKEEDGESLKFHSAETLYQYIAHKYLGGNDG